MTEVATKRLFIGGLASQVSKEELIEKFSVFGKVDNVKLTTRLDEKGVPVVTFAHLDLKGEEAKLKNCFTLYQNSKWKGSVLKLEHAKESFLDKLQKEREEKNLPQEPAPPPVVQKPPDISDIKGSAVPGTLLPGKTDWVVGKYGRVLPVLNLKKSYKLKMVKIDPSKLCHAAKVFKEDSPAENGSCDTLTWEISTPDSEITKKRKGEFPASQKAKKSKDNNSVQTTIARSFDKSDDNFKAKVTIKKERAFEIVKQGVDVLEIVKPGFGKASSAQRTANKSNIFDSDIESDAETKAAAVEPKKNQPKSSVKKNSLDTKANQKNSDSREGLSKQSGSKKNIEIDSGKLAATKAALSEPKKSPLKSATTPKGPDNHNKIKPVNLADTFQSQNEAIKVPEFKGLMMLSDESDREEEPPLTKVSFPKKSLTKPEDKTNLIAQKTTDKEMQPKSAKEKNTNQNTCSQDKTSANILSKSQGASNSSTPLKASSPANTEGFTKTLRESSEKKPTPKVSIKNNCDHKEDDGNESASSADTDEIIARHKEKLGIDGQPGGNNKRTPLSQARIKSAAPRSLDSSLSDYGLYTSEYSFNTPGLSDYSLPNVSVGSVSQDASGDSDLDSNDFELVAKKLERKAALSSVTVAPDLGTAERKLTPKVNKATKKTNVEGESSISEKINQAPKVTHESVEDSESATKVKKAPETTPVASSVSATKVKKALETTPVAGSVSTTKVKKAPETTPVAGSVSTTKVKKAPKTTRESDSDTSSNTKKSANCTVEPSNKNDPKPSDKDKKVNANEKRLQALKETSRLKQRQQSLIQKALKNVDSKDFSSANRKVFASDSEEEVEESVVIEEPGTSKDNSVTKSQKNSQKTGLTLFDSSSDSESDYDEMFKSKPHFEGKKGEKLMKMERKFGDSRFKLDAKFVDSDSEEEGVDKSVAAETINKDAVLEEEKAASLKVLENVIGKNNLDRFSEKLKRNTKHLIDMNTVRFDPTKVSQQKEAKVKPDEQQLPTKRLCPERESKDKVDPEVYSSAVKSTEKKKKQLASEPLSKEKLANSQPADEEKPVKDKVKKISQASAVGDNILEPMDTSEDLEQSRKTRVQMDKSLVNLFKDQKDKEDKAPVFSLLKQFDEKGSDSGESSGESDMETEESKDTKSKGVLSGLLKSTKSVESDTTKTAKVSNLKKTEALKDKNKVETLKFINEIDDDDDDSEDDSLPDPNDTLLKISEVETDKELLNAGKIDIRYTKELWHQRWEEIRPNLVKIFKRKHRDALKSKRVHNERKRRQDFVKNSKNKHWRQRRR